MARSRSPSYRRPRRCGRPDAARGRGDALALVRQDRCGDCRAARDQPPDGAQAPGAYLREARRGNQDGRRHARAGHGPGGHFRISPRHRYFISRYSSIPWREPSWPSHRLLDASTECYKMSQRPGGESMRAWRLLPAWVGATCSTSSSACSEASPRRRSGRQKIAGPGRRGRSSQSRAQRYRFPKWSRAMTIPIGISGKIR